MKLSATAKGFVLGIAIPILLGLAGFLLTSCVDGANPGEVMNSDIAKAVRERKQTEVLERQTVLLERQTVALERLAACGCQK